MRLLSISISVLFLSLVSCTEKGARQTVLSQDSIPTQKYEISLDRDTILKTSGGALLNIPKGTFTSDSKKTIVLDVKEAYDPETMLRGGLTTKTKNGPLSSGGMIYVGSKDSAQYRFEGKIKISLPTPVVNPAMSVFKGKVEEDGTISWEDQTALQNKEDAVYAKGQELFEGNCTACHAVGKIKVGPDLAYIGERRDRKWLYSFTRNSQKLIKGDEKFDPYAVCLYKAYNMTEMTAFPSFKDEELDAMYHFVDQYAHQNKIPYPDDRLYESIDSCAVYLQKKAELEKELSSLKYKREDFVKGNEKHIERNQPRVTPATPTPSSPSTPSPNVPARTERKESVIGYEDQPEYYQIEINMLGWYNIDIFLKDLPEVEKCNLQVSLDGAVEESQVYFIAPDYNVLLKGGLMADGETIAFEEIDGTVPLPVGRDAHVLSIRESSEGIWFARHSFKIKKEEKINLASTLINPSQVTEEIKKMNLKDFSLKINEATNAKEIRKMDQKIKLKEEELEAIRPKNFDCSCSFPRDVSADSAYSVVVVDTIAVGSMNIEFAKEKNRKVGEF